MRVHELVILVIFIGLLCNATSVQAECAWVLWKKYEVRLPGNKESHKTKAEWEPMSSFPASTSGLVLCIQIMKESVAKTTETWRGMWGNAAVLHSPARDSAGEESVTVLRACRRTPLRVMGYLLASLLASL